jgi:hypothetical protein
MKTLIPSTESEVKGLRQLLAELKAALDEHDRLWAERDAHWIPRCFDDTRQDRIVDCQCPACLNPMPESEGDATGEP